MRYLLLLLCTTTALAVQGQPHRKYYSDSLIIENPVTGETEYRVTTHIVPDTCFGSHNGKGQIRTTNMPAWMMAELEDMYEVLIKGKQLNKEYNSAPNSIEQYLAFKLGKNKSPVYIYELCRYEKEWETLANELNSADTIPTLRKIIHDNSFFKLAHKLSIYFTMRLANNAIKKGDTLAAIPYVQMLKSKYDLSYHEWCGNALEPYYNTIANTTDALYHYYNNRNNIDSTIYWICSIGLNRYYDHGLYGQFQKEAAISAHENGFANQLKQAIDNSAKTLIIKKGKFSYQYSLLVGKERILVDGSSYRKGSPPPTMEEHINYIKENSIYQFL